MLLARRTSSTRATPTTPSRSSRSCSPSTPTTPRPTTRSATTTATAATTTRRSRTSSKYQFIAPDNGQPLRLASARVQAYSGRYNEAIENLNRALAIKPDFVRVLSRTSASPTRAWASTAKAIAELREGRRARRTTTDMRRELPLARRCARAFIGGDTRDARRLLEAHREDPGRPKSEYAEIGAAVLTPPSRSCDGRAGRGREAGCGRSSRSSMRFGDSARPEDAAGGWKPHFPAVELS